MFRKITSALRSALLASALLLGAGLAAPASADGYHAFDGTNDTWTGSFTSTYGNPLTVYGYVYVTTHPVAIDQMIVLGNSNSSMNDSYACRIFSTDDVWHATSTDSAAGTNSVAVTKNIDATWTPVICEYIADNSRTIFVADQTANNTSTSVVADAIQHIRLGEGMAAINDFTGRLAYPTVWNVQLSDTTETALLAGNCPLKYEGANVIAHYSMQANSGTATNQGSDATGDLTRSGTDGYSATGGPGLDCTPTYTAGPTNGTFTNTQLPFTYTPDQNGTTYAAACTNGQTIVTGANVESGTCSGGAAVGTGNDASTATISDTVTIAGLVASTTYDVYIVHKAFETYSAVQSLPDRATTGASISFSAGPSEAPATDGFTISGTVTCTGTCTVEAVACAPGDAVPTNTELEAGQCGGGNAALMNAQENWTTAVANDFLLTSANKPARFDVYVAGTDGTNDTAVNTLADQDRSPKAGFAFVAHTSVATTSICDLDSSFNPDCAIGDVFEFEDDTNEDADCNISFEADGDFVLTPVAAGDCDGKRTFNISYEDVSSATTGLFTAPTTGNFTIDDLVCVNNSAPASTDEPENEIVLLIEDVAMTARDLTSLFTDADADALTFTVTGGTLPVGTALAGTGNKDWTGTPTTENEAGVAITITATDDCGSTDTFVFTTYVVTTFAVPDLDGLTVSAAETAIVTAAPWREQAPGLTVTSETCSVETPGTILTQDPAAAAQAAPAAPISVTIAQDCSAGTWVSYARVWMFREVRKVYLTTTGFKEAVEADLRGSAVWTRWKPGTLAWSGSSNMQIDVTDIPGVPVLRDDGTPAL